MRRKFLGSILILLLLSISTSLKAGETELYQVYRELLQAHVAEGIVDYRGFKKDEKLLDRYLDELDRTDPETLTDEQRLAFYINAYNGYTIKLILDNFDNNSPPSSIKKIGTLFKSPWKIKFAKVGGAVYTLDNIEHDIIRKQWHEPRIHFAVNCASKSCPPLISEPYIGSSIDAQLEASTRTFLADTKMNYLEGKTLYVSSLFKWYSEDFDKEPVQFFLDHTEGELHEQLSRLGNDITVKYLDYDWSLNSNKM